MDNFKSKMIELMLGVVNILLVISVIAFVLSGAITVFYTEFNTLFADMGWSQERFGWATAMTGSLGTLGLVSTRLTGTLKSGLILAKQDNTNQLNANQKLNDENFANQQKINEQLRNQMQLNNDANMKEMIAMRKALEAQNKFNDIQAEKYINAPDTLVDKDLKDKYKDYLDNKDKEV